MEDRGGGKKRRDKDTMHMLQRILDIIHRRIRQPTPLKNFQPVLRCLRLRLRFNQHFQLVAVTHAHGVCGVTFVGGPVGFLEALAHYGEEAVVTAADEDGAVGGGEAAVGDY